MKEASLPDLGCFAHTLQLIVHDGVLSQRAVTDLLSTCRRIVGHFKRSPLACSRLNAIQTNLGIPQHRLQQDEPTRWNSSLFMLQKIKEQKMALAAYASEYDISQLTAHQLDLVNKLISALSPIEELTNSISTNAASVSLIIPFIRILRKNLQNHDNDSGIRTMKAEMLKSLNKRYAGVEDNSPLVLATLLDARFKDKFFSGNIAAKQLLEEKVAELAQSTESSVASISESQGAIQEPSSKRPRTDVLDTLSEILDEVGAIIDSDSQSEVGKYFSEPLNPFHQANRYLWWYQNKDRFPVLAQLAKRYLSAPPTSVPSERLFSVAGDIYDEKRNRLAPEKAEVLMFIKWKLQLLIFGVCIVIRF